MNDQHHHTFVEFFTRATNDPPFPFQERFAEDVPCCVHIPTGLGKTAMAVLGWIWRRKFAEPAVKNGTPKRLVYCLPMRVLVEQIYSEVEQWLNRLNLSSEIGLTMLMGGVTEEDWRLYPEQDAIVIGTQDMLLSKALNRGYAQSRFSWPISFGLLNNDSLWVLDEIQLMDVGLATSTQFDGFRKKMKTVGDVHSIWMSATLEKTWLQSVDFDSAIFEQPKHLLQLNDSDKQNETVSQRWKSCKPVSKSDSLSTTPEQTAEEIISKHGAGSLTLAIFNQVDRAKEVFKALKEVDPAKEVILLHSRFRPLEREEIIKKLIEPLPEDGRIVISTQVVEAGLDISAKTLFTDLAPWSSMIQRFGRCNRKGEYNDSSKAEIVWFDYNEFEKNSHLPYESDELLLSRKLLNSITDGSPESLVTLKENMPEEFNQAMQMRFDHVIRQKDLMDLFDTTPDLAGADIDVSRFIRSGEEHDVQVFWRNWDFEETKSEDITEPEATRNELCSVSIGAFKKFITKKEKKKEKKQFVFRWDALAEQWRQVDPAKVCPGQVFMIHAAAGGYGEELGWDESLKNEVEIVDLPVKTITEGYSSDTLSIKPWLQISTHTNHVVEEIHSILDSLSIDEEWKDALCDAARWHDWGKAHEVFQNAIQDGREISKNDGSVESERERPSEWQGKRDMAKAAPGYFRRYERKSFRHELASAIGMLCCGKSDLSAYLAAAHHGRVRLSIRSMPNETPPDTSETLFARGVYDGDILPSVDLGDGVTAPETRLSMKYMQLGRSDDGEPSWVERMLKLRESLGPFRLAYLETLLRAADARASKKEEENPS